MIINQMHVELPRSLDEQLAAYCKFFGMTPDQAVRQAIEQLLNNSPKATPYALGAEGFGADVAHSGDIAKNSKQLLKERFRA